MAKLFFHVVRCSGWLAYGCYCDFQHSQWQRARGAMSFYVIDSSCFSRNCIADNVVRLLCCMYVAIYVVGCLLCTGFRRCIFFLYRWREINEGCFLYVPLFNVLLLLVADASWLYSERFNFHLYSERFGCLFVFP